jgi:hypothetical protein
MTGEDSVTGNYLDLSPSAYFLRTDNLTQNAKTGKKEFVSQYQLLITPIDALGLIDGDKPIA